MRQAVYLGLVFLVGTLNGVVWRTRAYEKERQVVEYVNAYQKAELIKEVIKARAAAGRCQGIIVDHWSANHRNIPGTPELVAVAQSLQQAYSGPREQE